MVRTQLVLTAFNNAKILVQAYQHVSYLDYLIHEFGHRSPLIEYSATEATIPRCLSFPSEHGASQSKWQSADLDLVKLTKKGKREWPALFQGNVCI